MVNVYFDFNKIVTLQDFYVSFVNQVSLKKEFGYNLDALWDYLVDGSFGNPLKIEIVKVDSPSCKIILDLLNDCSNEVDFISLNLVEKNED